jgi:hypothetical protein
MQRAAMDHGCASGSGLVAGCLVAASPDAFFTALAGTFFAAFPAGAFFAAVLAGPVFLAGVASGVFFAGMALPDDSRAIVASDDRHGLGVTSCCKVGEHSPLQIQPVRSSNYDKKKDLFRFSFRIQEGSDE